MSKRKLAQQRNFTKARLLGFDSAGMILTSTERQNLDYALNIIKNIVEKFDYNSSKLGLNVIRYKCIQNSKYFFSADRLFTKKELNIYKDYIKKHSIKFEKVIVNEIL